MAFGKLTITTENGELEEYELTRPTTSIGRQPGNDIVLPTSAVSRYHAQVDAAEGQVFLVDLGTVNGSFVNDQQVEANGRVALKDGDVVQLGDVRLVFSSPRRGTGPLSAHPIEHVVENIPIRLVLDDPQQPVAPGSFLQFALVIENHSGVERVFTVEAGGMDGDWIRINRREVRLADDDQTEILISVRPPRSSATRPGRYPLRVRVAYKDDPAKVVELLREVDVMVFAGMAMAMKAGRQPGNYHLAVQNQGNQLLELELSGYQADKLLGFSFTPPQFTIDSGQTQQILLRVTPNGSIPPGERVSFAAVAHSRDVAHYTAPLLGYYREPRGGRSAGWLAGLLGLPVLVVLGLLVVALILVGLVAGDVVRLPGALSEGPEAAQPIAVSATPLPPTSPPLPTAIPTPVVNLTSFGATPAQLTFGTAEQVEFTWVVDMPGNVKSYQLRENVTRTLVPLSVSAPSVARFDIDAADLVDTFGWGSHDYTLTVTGVDDVPRSATASLEIDPVLCTLQTPAEIHLAPDTSSGPAIATPPSHQVVIAGRTADKTAVQVWDLGTHKKLGWVNAADLSCPVTPEFSDYIVLTPGPSPTNTPAG